MTDPTNPAWSMALTQLSSFVNRGLPLARLLLKAFIHGSKYEPTIEEDLQCGNTGSHKCSRLALGILFLTQHVKLLCGFRKAEFSEAWKRAYILMTFSMRLNTIGVNSDTLVVSSTCLWIEGGGSISLLFKLHQALNPSAH